MAFASIARTDEAGAVVVELRPELLDVSVVPRVPTGFAEGPANRRTFAGVALSPDVINFGIQISHTYVRFLLAFQLQAVHLAPMKLAATVYPGSGETGCIEGGT